MNGDEGRECEGGYKKSLDVYLRRVFCKSSKDGRMRVLRAVEVVRGEFVECVSWGMFFCLLMGHRRQRAMSRRSCRGVTGDGRAVRRLWRVFGWGVCVLCIFLGDDGEVSADSFLDVQGVNHDKFPHVGRVPGTQSHSVLVVYNGGRGIDSSCSWGSREEGY